jgi:peptidoglycan/xylan/chitin deacetylase (PgdA/CDA1 family)
MTDYTEHILDLLKSYNAKATFFMTGANINKGRIDEKHADTIKRVDAEGHQVASHTWTHLDLSKISALDRKNQMWMNEMALRNVLGKIPTYMRPPYSSCTVDSGCQQDMADLGYHISYFNVDTDDYNQNNASKIQVAKDKFKNGITNSSAIPAAKDKWLTIGHDILDQTANNLTEYMLKTLQDLGYKAVTMGECMGDSKKNWYRGEDGKGVGNDTEATNSTSSNGSSGSQPSGSSGSSSGTGSSSASASPPAATGAASVVSASSVSAIMLMFSVAFAYVM